MGELNAGVGGKIDDKVVLSHGEESLNDSGERLIKLPNLKN